MSAPQGTRFTRLLSVAAAIEPAEASTVLRAMLLYFCVFAGYFAVRPVRESIGTVLGRERVGDLFVITWVVSIAVVMLYATLVARVRRAVLLPAIYGAVAVLLAAIGTVLRLQPDNLTVASTFYVLISVLNLFIISVFWSFMLEVLNSEQTKRLFGAIAVGGSAGALVGPLLTDALVRHVGNPGVLYLGSALFVVAIVLQRSLLRHWQSTGAAQSENRGVGSANPFAGLMLVLRSPYLLGVAAFMILLSSVTTFLYLEQLDVVKHAFASTEERTQVFSRIDYIVQGLTIAFQFLLTGRVARRFGLVLLLSIVPLLMVGGFLALAASGSFAVLAIVMIVRRVGEYAFVRPGREMLYSVLDTETKYKAKSFNDVPVYRGGDALAAQLQGLLKDHGVAAATLAVLGAALAALWGLLGYFLGRQSDAARFKSDGSKSPSGR